MNQKENDSFVQSLLPISDLLDSAIWWISNNLNPEDVFSTSQLVDWAENSGFVKGE